VRQETIQFKNIKLFRFTFVPYSFCMKSTAIILLFLVLGLSPCFAADYKIGHTRIRFIDSSREKRWVPAEVYYPANTQGNDVSVAAGLEGKVPVIVFGHGFVMKWTAYQYLWEALVKQGYLVAFVVTESSFDAKHEDFARDMLFVLHSLEKAGHQQNSIFYNKLSGTNCIMGHSMGGGAAVLAAAADSTVHCLVTFAAAQTHPSAVKAAKKIKQPSLFFGGGNDCITPQGKNQIPMYDSLPGNCNMFVSIKGGSHCYMADKNFACDFGEFTCSPKPGIERRRQHEKILQYLLPWLEAMLLDHKEKIPEILNMMKTDTTIICASNCLR